MAEGAKEGTLLWEPSERLKAASRLTAYMHWLDSTRALHFNTYDELWQWSVSDLESFWASVAEFCQVTFSAPWRRVLPERTMPGAQWFDGARLNYAENVFRNSSSERPALIARSELRPLTEISWAELLAQVSAVAAALRAMGVVRGDRVAGLLPNIPEAVVAFLACASIGAIWSSCSPEFGSATITDRFGQIEPKVLFAADGYAYSGKSFDRLPVIRNLQHALPSLESTVVVDYLRAGSHTTLEHAISWEEMVAAKTPSLTFEQVPFDHPLWVLYSSGTTGLPKALVHGHGGVVLEHAKVLALHLDCQPGERLFWFTSTGWMMWNFIVGGLLVGATPVLFDGSPNYPSLDVLWEFAEQAGITTFGTSAAFIMGCSKAGIRPGRQHDLSQLRAIGSTGSPLPPEGFAWAYDAVKPDLWLASASGGTDLVTAFVLGCPLLPVHAGELQCLGLGAKVESFDEQGRAQLARLGELVITEPMPSMPLYFWNDPGNKRYRESYFDLYPGVWRHGDWIKITARGSAVIAGRSDATLNRQGVRIGSAEIYGAVESLPEVADSLVIGVERPGGRYYMPLFITLTSDAELNEALKVKIKAAIRGACSPRHVPDDIIAVPAIPRTLSNKKLEVPIKKLFMGVSAQAAVNPGATTDPKAVEHFARLANEFLRAAEQQ